jgi:hypothetical protein
VKLKGFSDSVNHSELASEQTPPVEQFRAKRHVAGGRVPEPAVDEKLSATREDLDRFFEVLSGLTPSRVRFLYRQRWEACRLNPGNLPRLTDIQYLETTFRVLEARAHTRNDV